MRCVQQPVRDVRFFVAVDGAPDADGFVQMQATTAVEANEALPGWRDVEPTAEARVREFIAQHPEHSIQGFSVVVAPSP